jgi:CRP-like cAMP-binding protein
MEILMVTAHALCQNQLLAVLPEEERARLAHVMKLVSVPLGQSLYESGTQIRQVFFPTTTVVSLRYELEDGLLAETAVVGKEGVVGIALFMGGETTLSRAVVEKTGQAYRLEGHLLKSEFHRAGPMQRILMRYTKALFTEMAQTVVCIRHHSLDQQLCRWLLRRFDRSPSSSLVTSQEMIANVFGVRRGSISAIAVNLRKAALIKYDRCRISLLDREGMEKRSCECYAIIKNEFDLLLAKARTS